ncbi:hypothetical protein PAXINDRAFT_163229 [Paxillus involutus ATCC 200175]|uniref:Uncharacterized protein n=1 Tax=Paxillus involutus ATCC 200175 TaxID=664439 RepID=A0A0C9TX17_PAXIN|nr:hypothetical protein PAXINDRAFT_163229 [Paxillus involutus ATCC 200175]
MARYTLKNNPTFTYYFLVGLTLHRPTSSPQSPDPSKSIKLSPARQRLVDDIIALYSCQPTIERVKRYTPDCIYDDQFVYANNRYKMAGQWCSWTFRVIPKTATINALVSLSLDPNTIKYHKDQANDKDYSHEGLGFTFKKWQADNVVKFMDSSEVEAFKGDQHAATEEVRKYGTSTEEGNAPKKNF